MVGGVLFTALWYRTYDGRRKERKVRSMTKPSFIYARQSRATRCRRALRKSITARKNTTSSSIDERQKRIQRITGIPFYADSVDVNIQQ